MTEIAVVLIALAYSVVFYKLGYMHGEMDVLLKEMGGSLDRIERSSQPKENRP